MEQKTITASADLKIITTTDWNRTYIDFGIIAPGTLQDGSFTFIGTNNTLKNVMTGCGSCTKATIQGNKVNFVWTVDKDISTYNDLIMTQTKTITVMLSDNTTRTLTFTAKLNKLLCTPS